MNSTNALPTRNHSYLSPFLCSDQWDHYQPRDSDIVVCSAFKAGTTWMQTIIANLIFQDGDFPSPVMELSPWIDRFRFDGDLELMTESLEAQTHRRVVKTHLPLDALRFMPQLKYIFLTRDARDVFMSLWNHHSHYSDKSWRMIERAAEIIDVKWPPFKPDIDQFWHEWMTKSWFSWESEGYPYWSLFHNVASWWPYRHLPNILFVHYNDLLSDVGSEIRRLADFVEIDLSADVLDDIVLRVSIDEMRKNGEKIMGRFEQSFDGGAQTFINRGTNGRWKEWLSAENLALYSNTMKRHFDDEAAHWMENGGLI